MDMLSMLMCGNIGPKKNAPRVNVGVLCLKHDYELKQGDVFHNETENIMNWKCHIATVNVDFTQCQKGEKSDDIKKSLQDAVKQLTKKNVSIIISDCGFFAHYQSYVCSLANCLVVLSACACIPSLHSNFPQMKKISIVTANGKSFQAGFLKILAEVFNIDEHLMNRTGMCEIFYNRFQIIGVEETKIGQIIANESLSFHESYENARDSIQELIDYIEQKTPDDGFNAMIIECTELTTFSDELKKHFHVPVYDILTVAEMLLKGTKEHGFEIEEEFQKHELTL